MSRKWELLVNKSLNQRLSVGKFQAYVELLQKEIPIEGHQLCSLIVQHVTLQEEGIDPLVATFVEGLVVKGLIQPHDVLQALHEAKSGRRASSDIDAFTATATAVTRTAALDHTLLICLAKGFSTNAFKYDSSHLKKLLSTLSAWMTGAVAQNDDVMVQGAAVSSPEVMQAIMDTRQSLATLLVTCFANAQVSDALKSELPEGEILGKIMELFCILC